MIGTRTQNIYIGKNFGANTTSVPLIGPGLKNNKLLENIYLNLLAGDYKCIIDKTRRNWCPACRLEKCFSVNMNPTGSNI